MGNRGKTLRKARATQADVARLAGVSQATVSYVLNNNTSVSVPVETRQRIHDAIQQLGYIPDRNARSLRTSKTFTIACVIPDITNPFYPAFARGVQDIADVQGYDLILYNTDGIAEKEQKCLHSILQGKADGVVATFSHLGLTELQPLYERNIAVVKMDVAPVDVHDLPVDVLYIDNVEAAQTAVSFLIEHGHRRIAMIGGTDAPPRDTRLLGYRQAMAARQLVTDELLIHSGDFTQGSGYRAMRDLLDLPSEIRPTAVFAANDLMAIGALMAITEAGLHVPQDIAVVGFDDIPAASLVNPPLTTITHFTERLGRRAAEMLLERLNGDVHAPGRDEAMPYQLIIRESA
ncbi:MAG: LacI family DNA-binding transcriptional regulator [Anaerolineae bacterium]|nr:LacI family DNA-binding transcriptional regulator [Anaerolineae bacterium]